MSLKSYIKDRWFTLMMYGFMLLLIYSMMLAYRMNYAFMIYMIGVIIFFLVIVLIYEYYRKKMFYKRYLVLLEELDQKYLICEMIKEPAFLDGKILYHSLYEINKTMLEKISELELAIDQFKDYVEMWIHEVKIPLSHLTLTVHNHQTSTSPLILEQVHKLENQIDLILYYVRSQTAQKDYLIKSTSLSQMIKNVVKKNKNVFIYQKVKIILNHIDYEVYTDSKWLEFMLNQILNNCFQYTKENEQSIIKISAYQKDNQVVLSILDNGIGIQESDLSRVFDKSFTGHNGRIQKKSTGMGLYICQKLCQQLGHHISIESKYHEYTKVMITFYNDHFYDVLQ